MGIYGRGVYILLTWCESFKWVGQVAIGDAINKYANLGRPKKIRGDSKIYPLYTKEENLYFKMFNAWQCAITLLIQVPPRMTGN